MRKTAADKQADNIDVSQRGDFCNAGQEWSNDKTTQQPEIETKEMTDFEFRANVRGAMTLNSSKSPDCYFWNGYRRGLNRHYHGTVFGTAKEHDHWMKLLTSTLSERHRYLGLGYRCGYKGINVKDALQHFQQSDARSMALAAFNSVCS